MLMYGNPTYENEPGEYYSMNEDYVKFPERKATRATQHPYHEVQNSTFFYYQPADANSI